MTAKTVLVDAKTAAPQPTSDGNRQRDVSELLSSVLKEVWGFDRFRPLQLDAMRSVMDQRDSLIVFPTGGGKSLCFQAPAVCRNELGVVVSPLISLMKDQVDALQACGVRAAFLNSSMSSAAESQVIRQIRNGELQLLYLAPERLLTQKTQQLLAAAQVAFFAIDEAHCVSEWGHDFRPEYRGLSILKQQYPGVAIHAYTATATQQVRDDIVKQLGLVNVNILVGSMDRPNLMYQVRRRGRGLDQVVAILKKHMGESGIIYCISRKDVEANCAAINALGFSARPYHAGLSTEDRNQNQEAFLREEIDIIVATVAFGMGIDKSNVRYVIHAAMPKSLEAYQQESGRAGRDGLEAECWLFYTPGDFGSWQRLINRSESDAGRQGALQALKAIGDFCHGLQCRHAALARHFGEQLTSEECGNCDVCLEELELVEDPLTLAQKIVSCVFRVEQRFGGDYVSQVLIGSKDKRVLQNGHNELSTYGLLETENRQAVRSWIEQLISQDFLAKVGEYNLLKITDKGSQLLRGDSAPKLTRPPETVPDNSKSRSSTSWEGVDRGLFETLRELRGNEARRREVPAYVVFSDASLRDMARRRPSTLAALRLVQGVGQQKQHDFGPLFLEAILRHCQSADLGMDVAPPEFTSSKSTSAEPPGPSRSAALSFPLFDEGLAIAEVANKMERAESTTRGYLCEYIRFKKITDASRWVDTETITKVSAVVNHIGIGPLKPIHIALDEKVSYDEIRIVVECMKNDLDDESSP
jgi:ATP-dependent DNA helicase RecQ